MKNIWVNSEGRLRCSWRLLFQFFCFLTILLIVQFVQGLAQERRNLILYNLGSALYLAGMGILMWIFARWIDRRNIVDFGLHIDREWWLDGLVGLAIGAVNLTLVALIEQSLGWATFRLEPASVFNAPFAFVILAVLINLFAIGVGEELTFRAYQIRNLAEGLSRYMGAKGALATAWILVSGIFGLLHMLNPNATVMSGLNVTLAGLMLGLAYILTGELAMPLGIHIAWGFFEGFIYGFPNSGMAPSSWLIVNRVTGPELWTGGAFGPEAGLLVSVLLVIDVFFIIGWVKMRRRWRGRWVELAEYGRPEAPPLSAL